jgi:S-adenosylmethionine:tRNA ribosyltransferase-isomerase
MDASLFDYNLPEELIAQAPVRNRDESRLLVLDRSRVETTIGKFADITDYLSPGDVVVINTTKVFKARLLGSRRSGAEVEVFLVRPEEGDPLRWEALVRPTRRVKEGEEIHFGDQQLRLEQHHGDGVWSVTFDSGSSRDSIIARYGHVPLPLYIKREDTPSDIRRYQTVFARSDQVGAVAAPTAGFHFTKPLIKQLRDNGVKFAELCLHVGPGTFKPMTAENINEHVVDPEWAELSAESARTINEARGAGHDVFVVGTTSTRALESAPIVDGVIQPFSGMVDLYIRPGHKFQVVDHLITNFHLPRSSLLVLVSAFVGRERILAAYEQAIEARMRFYSYGDAMLIL